MKITWFSAILTSGFISLTMVTTVHLLRSKNIQRSIICGLLKVSRKGFEVLFLLTSSSNLPLGYAEGQKWSGQPSLSWCNFSRWPPHRQNLDIAVSFSHVVRSGNLGKDGQSFEFSIFSSHFVRQSLKNFSQAPPKMARHRPLVPLPCRPISAMHEMMVPADGPLVSATTITAVRSVKATTPVSTVGGATHPPVFKLSSFPRSVCQELVPPSRVTPIDACKLQHELCPHPTQALVGYAVSALSFGFRLGFSLESVSWKLRSQKMPMVCFQPLVIDHYLITEFEKGGVASPFSISPLPNLHIVSLE